MAEDTSTGWAADDDRPGDSRAPGDARPSASIYGLVVRSLGFVGGVGASFKALRRGEVSQYTQLLEDARRHAT